MGAGSCLRPKGDGRRFARRGVAWVQWPTPRGATPAACGRSSMVERQLPKLKVAGSSPVARSTASHRRPLRLRGGLRASGDRKSCRNPRRRVEHHRHRADVRGRPSLRRARRKGRCHVRARSRSRHPHPSRRAPRALMGRRPASARPEARLAPGLPRSEGMPECHTGGPMCLLWSMRTGATLRKLISCSGPLPSQSRGQTVQGR